MKKVASISTVIFGALVILVACLGAINYVSIEEHYSSAEQWMALSLAFIWIAGIETAFIYLRYFIATEATVVAIDHAPAMRVPSPSDEQLALYRISENGIYVEEQVA